MFQGAQAIFFEGAYKQSFLRVAKRTPDRLRRSGPDHVVKVKGLGGPTTADRFEGVSATETYIFLVDPVGRFPQHRVATYCIKSCVEGFNTHTSTRMTRMDYDWAQDFLQQLILIVNAETPCNRSLRCGAAPSLIRGGRTWRSCSIADFVHGCRV